MILSWIIQGSILTSSAGWASCDRGSKWPRLMGTAEGSVSCWSCCAISETKWTGNVSETTVGGFFFFTVVPPLFTCHLTPRWKQNMGMFGVSACMAVCVGIVQWTAAKVISCLPRPLFPASCWQGTHGRGINEISRLLLPLPSVNLCPLLVRSAALQAFSG